MSQANDCFVSVVSVIRDNESSIPDFVASVNSRLKEAYSNYEILLIDDGSRDNSKQAAVNLLGSIANLRVIQLSRNFGDEKAFFAGLENAIGDVVVIVSITHDSPDLIPLLVRETMQSSGVVAGIDNRQHSKSIFRKFFVQIYKWYLGRFTSINIFPDASDSWAFSRTAVNSIICRTFSPPAIRYCALQVGFSPKTLSIDLVNALRPPRQSKLRNEVLFGLSVIFSNSIVPARLAGLIGVLTSLALFFFSLFSGVFLNERVVGIFLGLLFSQLFFAFLIACETFARQLTLYAPKQRYTIESEFSSNSFTRDADKLNIVDDAR